RSTDCPAVVVAKQDDRNVVDRREIRSFVEVALRRGAVSENRERDGIASLESLSPSKAHRMADMGSDGDGPSSHSPLVRIPPPFVMASGLREQNLRMHPPRDSHRHIAVAGENPIRLP